MEERQEGLMSESVGGWKGMHVACGGFSANGAVRLLYSRSFGPEAARWR